METILQKKSTFGEVVIGAAMDRSGLNQTEIYKATGISIKTQKSWRAGLSAPTFRACNRFAADLHINILRPYLSYKYPELIDLAPESSDDLLRHAATVYMQSTTEQEIRLLRHLITRESWPVIRESFNADAHLPMFCRVISTYQLLTMQAEAKARGSYDLAGELPDDGIVGYAMGKGKDAYANGHAGYGMPTDQLPDDQWRARLSAAMRRAKENAGLSNEYLAFSLGRTTGTISLWLSGAQEPNIFLLVEFFEVCHADPVRNLMDLAYPADCNVDAPPMSEDRRFIIDYFSRASMRDVREVCYWIYGLHGGSWHSMLQKYDIGARLPEHYCRFVSSTVYSMYDMCRDAGTLVCTEHIMPDMDILRAGAVGV